MAANDYDIHALRSLIKATSDSRKEFLSATDAAESTHFLVFLTDSAERRHQAVAALEVEVRRLGEKPDDENSLSGAAHQRLREMIVNGNNQEIIEEIERDDDALRTRFEDAFANEQLSPDTRAVVVEAYRSVEAGREQASGLKLSLAL